MVRCHVFHVSSSSILMITLFLVVYVLIPYMLNVFIVCFHQRNANQQHRIFVAYLIYQIFLTTVTSALLLILSYDSKYDDLQNKLSTISNVCSGISSALPNSFMHTSFSDIISPTKKPESQSLHSSSTTHIPTNSINPKNHIVFKYFKPDQRHLDFIQSVFNMLIQTISLIYPLNPIM